MVRVIQLVIVHYQFYILGFFANHQHLPLFVPGTYDNFACHNGAVSPTKCSLTLTHMRSYIMPHSGSHSLMHELKVANTGPT